MNETVQTEPRYLIVNADDFGASTGINRGIVECHQRGIVTSTSFMTTGRAKQEAIELSRENPNLSIGLHFDVWGEDEREFDLNDTEALRIEFQKQLDDFVSLFGRLPTHVDSHRHAHRRPGMMPLFQELVRPIGVPLRDDGQVRFIGMFYAQWEWLVTDLEKVSVDFLLSMLRTEIKPGWTEFSCHAGYASPDFQSIYLAEREAEVATLTDPRISNAIREFGIVLVSYNDFPTQAKPVS
jgi:chitin disaccharide deacetylase